MAAVALGRMSGVVQAKLPPRLGVQAPGGLARPLVLAFLLVSATVSSGKGGAGAGSRGGPGRGPGGRQGQRQGASCVRSRRRCVDGAGVPAGPRGDSRLSEVRSLRKWGV